MTDLIIDYNLLEVEDVNLILNQASSDDELGNLLHQESKEVWIEMRYDF